MENQQKNKLLVKFLKEKEEDPISLIWLEKWHIGCMAKIEDVVKNVAMKIMQKFVISKKSHLSL